MTPSRKRRKVRFERQLTVLTVCAVAVPAQLYLAIPLVPQLERSFGVSHTAASWTSSAFALAYAVGFLVFGPMPDRFGARRVLVGGMIGLAASTACAFASSGLAMLVLSRVAQGLAAATFAPVALVWVTKNAAPERRRIALATLTTGLLGAGLAGQLYGTAMLGLLPWRWVFGAASALYLLLAHLLYKALEAGSARSTVSLSQVYQPVIRVLTKRATASVFVAAPAVFGSFVGFYTALDAHLISVWHFSPEALLATEAVGCLGLAAALTTRHWAPRLMNPRSQTLLGFSIAAAGVLVAQFGTLWLYPIAGSICYVAGISLVVPGLVALLAVHAADARGAAVAVNTFMLFVGAAAAPFVVGHLGYRPSLAVLAAALLGAAGVVTARVPREAQAGQPSGQQGEPPPGDRAAITPAGLKPHQGPPGQGSRSPRVPDRDPQSLPSRIR